MQVDYQRNLYGSALSILLVICSLILFISLECLALHNSRLPYFTETRYIYMSCLVIVLPLCFGCIQLSTCLLDKSYKNKINTSVFLTGILVLWLIFWLCAIPALHGFWPLILFGKPVLYAPFKHPGSMLLILVFTVFAICLATLPILLRQVTAKFNQDRPVLWMIFVVLLSLLVGSQNVSGLAAVQIEAPRWDANFEPVLYPLSQVLAGKTLLVDLPAQYGLYAELIAPLFKIIGFSITKITVFFGLLEAISYLALAVLFLKLTESTLFRLFWLVSSAVLFGLAYQNYSDHLYFEPYFQYFPIRLFFPAISVFFFWRFMLIEPRIRNVVIFSMLLTGGVIWNLDSGVPALGSFLVYLVFSVFFTKKPDRRRWLKVFGLAVLSMALTFTLFAIYMRIKSGVAIPWNEWLHYQRVFYISGYGAIPLPLAPHPWMVVIVLYIIGISGYMRSAFLVGNPENFWKLMLYLGVMGLGLFAYYQHHSDNAVLVAACWPALFMGYACSERFLKCSVTHDCLKLGLLAILPCFLLGIAFCGFFIYKIPTMVSQAHYNWKMAFHPARTPVAQNIAFMRARISAEDRHSIELVTWLQALYFAELNIPSAIKGAGTGGAMPGEDQAALVRRIEAAKPRIIFLQQGFMPLVEENLKKSYHLVDKNPNNLLEFRRDTAAGVVTATP